MEIMNAKGSPKAQRNKGTDMSDQTFAELKEALEDARAFERGRTSRTKSQGIEGPGLKRHGRLRPAKAKPNQAVEPARARTLSKV